MLKLTTTTVANILQITPEKTVGLSTFAKLLGFIKEFRIIAGILISKYEDVETLGYR